MAQATGLSYYGLRDYRELGAAAFRSTETPTMSSNTPPAMSTGIRLGNVVSPVGGIGGLGVGTGVAGTGVPGTGVPGTGVATAAAV